MTCLFFGSKLDKAEVKPLLTALDNASERTAHLNEVDFLERGVQVANKQRIVEIASTRRRRRHT